jgi:hypothetical protein
MTTLSNGNAALDALHWRAEILQAMFWMRGEGIAEAVDRLAEFLGVDIEVVEGQMHGLVSDGPEVGQTLRSGQSGYLRPGAVACAQEQHADCACCCCTPDSRGRHQSKPRMECRAGPSQGLAAASEIKPVIHVSTVG